MTETPILLQAYAIEKAYAGVRALCGVHFELRAGEVHALMGENGAGKSTLIKVITGAVAADAGSLIVSGETIRDNSPARARQLGIAAIYQQPALFPQLTVEENIAVVLEDGASLRRVNWRERRKRAQALLSSLGAQIDPAGDVEKLSMPEQQ